MAAARDPTPGPGCLVLVVGPSGAGKDTLITLAAASLQGQPRIVFGRRVVTRRPDASEDHDSLTSEAFDAMDKRGEFALTWRAHGFAYGVPNVAMRRLEFGDTLVFNVSRAIIGAAQARFARVRVVCVTAPPQILESRLKGRGRDGDIAGRLARSEEISPLSPPDLFIENVGAPETNAKILAKFLVGTLS